MQFQKSSNILLPREKPKHNGTDTLKANSGKNDIPGNFKKYFYLFIHLVLLGLSCGMWNLWSQYCEVLNGDGNNFVQYFSVVNMTISQNELLQFLKDDLRIPENMWFKYFYFLKLFFFNLTAKFYVDLWL